MILNLDYGSIFANTVEPPNKGHIEIMSIVPCREVVLISEVDLHRERTNWCVLVFLCTEVVLISEGPLSEVQMYSRTSIIRTSIIQYMAN